MKSVSRAVPGTAAFLAFAALGSAALANEVGIAPATPTVPQPLEAMPVPVVPEATPDAAVVTTARPDLAQLQPGDTIAYPTLAAAVAAQPTGAASDELRCLAGAIYFESRGEPLAGQLGVAEVILNRAASGRFASGVCGVVTQRGQFSFVKGGRIPEIGDNPNYRTAVAVAKVAMAEVWESDASDALYFNARRAAGGGRARVASIGNHVFYR